MTEYQDKLLRGDRSLPSLPTDWSWVRLKYLCEISAEYGLNISANEYKDEGVRFVRTTDINSDGSLSEEGVYLERDLCEDYLLKEGDLLLTRSGATVGKSYRYTETDELCSFASYLVRFRLLDKMSSRFVAYFFQSKLFDAFVKQESTQATISNVSGRKFARMPIPVPDKVTQEQLSNYLDHHTGQIDSLIQKFKRLSKYLDERGDSLTTSVITEGLRETENPSGTNIPWIKQIPSHWDETKLKFVTNSIIDSEHKTPPSESNGEFHIIRTSDIREGRILVEGAERTSEEVYQEWTQRGQPEPGDLIFTREAPAGEVGIVPEGDKLLLGQRTVLLKPDTNQVLPEYLCYSLQSDIVDWFININSQGSTVEHLNINDLRNLPLFLPPVEEQKEIVGYVDDNIRSHVDLKDELETIINLLIEKREAIITDAITGNINTDNRKSQQEISV